MCFGRPGAAYFLPGEIPCSHREIPGGDYPNFFESTLLCAFDEVVTTLSAGNEISPHALNAGPLALP
jgi:hypothetical protein